MDGGLLEETSDNGTGPSGRPTRPLQVVAAAGHFLGVRLTPDAAHAVITNLRAEILGSAQAPIGDTSPEGVVTTIADLVDRLRTEQGVVPNRVGVSVGGLVEAHTTIRSSPFFDWDGPVDLATMVRKTTGIPTVVDNDVMALTRAQSWFGYGRGLDRFAVITTRRRIGLGIVIHGELVESPDSRPRAARTLPARRDRTALPRSATKDALRRCCPMKPSPPAPASLCAEPVTYDEALDLAAQGQPAAKTVVDQAARALGRLIAAVANLTTCYRIIITGEGARLAEAAGEAMQQQIAADRDPAAAPLHLQTPHLTADDWAQGPAVLAIQTLVRPSGR